MGVRYPTYNTLYTLTNQRQPHFCSDGVFLTLRLALAFILLSGCAGSKPAAEEPADPVEPVEQPTIDPAPGPSDTTAEGKKVWEAIPDAPHGQCCTSDEECGPIKCQPYEYAIESCKHVCTYACESGDLCPIPGGTLGPPIPCPDSGLCPVGPPYV